MSMRRFRWFLTQFSLRWDYATREPYDLAANRELLAKIDRHYAEGY